MLIMSHQVRVQLEVLVSGALEVVLNHSAVLFLLPVQLLVRVVRHIAAWILTITKLFAQLVTFVMRLVLAALVAHLLLRVSLLLVVNAPAITVFFYRQAKELVHIKIQDPLV